MRIAVIPARGGSRRIPRKNIRPFHGKPIIAYSIETAMRAYIFDRVWVSTDDTLIAEIAHQAGAFVLYRPASLAVDEVGTQRIMKHALTAIKGVEIACCLYATAPMLQPNTLITAMRRLAETGRDYVVPVATWLRDPGQFYMGRADAFIEGRPLLGLNTALLQIDPATECDINTEDDWARAEAMYAALHNVEETA